MYLGVQFNAMRHSVPLRRWAAVVIAFAITFAAALVLTKL